MSSYFFDLEANGLLDTVSQFHVGVFRDKETGEEYIFTEEQVDGMFRLMDGADELIGHNIIGYDFPMLKKLFNYVYHGKVYDSLVLSRMLKPNRLRPFNMPSHVKGGPHSVAAWGFRLGHNKVEHEDWTVYSGEMRHRCVEDVRIQEKIFYMLQEEMVDGDWSRAIPMSMKLFQVFDKIEQYGWKVDQEWMHYCIGRLDGMINRIDLHLRTRLPFVREDSGEMKKPFVKSGGYSSHMIKWFLDTSPSSYVAYEREANREVMGPFCRVHYRRLDLGKRNETVGLLLDLGWIPEQWNYDKEGEKTSPKLSKTDSFIGVTGNIGRHISRRVQARHRRSLVQGLFKLVREDGRIGSRITGLAETARVKHAGIVNIPNTDSFFGKHIRKIFISEEDMEMVGVDSAGNQMRQLCALMGDDEYEYAVVHGDSDKGTDIHTVNMKAAGLAKRSQAKTFIYGFLFGAGDAKVGSIVGGSAANGKALKAKFLDGLPLLKALIERLKVEWRSHAKKRMGKWGMEYYNGWVAGLDGRPVYIKSEHAILVYVLQNMEAIQMSYALLFAYKWLEGEGLVWGDDYGIVCFYHDEINIECKPEHKEKIGEIVKEAIIYAGKFLKIKTPHDGDIKFGKDWYDIH